MNTREQRLRSELLAESELITQESLRPLSLSDVMSRTPARPHPARRVWLAPVAAAIAVAVIAAAAGFITHQKAGQGPEPLGGGKTTAGVLEGIDPLSASNVWAVGYLELDRSGGFPDEALIVHWDGSHWRRVPAPNVRGESELYSVAGSSPDDLWAVGRWAYGKPLIIHWNGQKWRQERFPGYKQPGGLLRVSVTSATDAWAVGQVGSYPQPLVVHWNGSTWQRVPAPRAPKDQALEGVTALAANDAWAVGTNSRGLLLSHWNGSSWRHQSVPNLPLPQGSVLFNVAASSANSVWAVGNSEGQDNARLILHWTGGQWHLVPAPVAKRGTGGSVSGLAIISPNDIWASGGGDPGEKTVFLHWNGRSWVQLTGRTATFPGRIEELAGTSANDLWAVGYRGTGGEVAGVPQVLHWNGRTWKRVFGPSSTGDLLENNSGGPYPPPHS
jgi:hypothetical protein